MNMRLFSALDVSQALQTQIVALPRDGLDSPRWSHVQDLHITLRYLGEAPEERLADIMDCLEGIRVKKFSIVVRGLALFRRKRQAVLYAPVESTRMVTHLSAEVTERWQRLGFIFTEQSYTPHVTIARLKSDSGADSYIHRNATAIFSEWTAERFSLYRSAEPDDKGKRYSVLQSYALKSF